MGGWSIDVINNENKNICMALGDLIRDEKKTSGNQKLIKKLACGQNYQE